MLKALSAYLLFSTSLVSTPVKAHDLSAMHRFCLDAEDYTGCMNINKMQSGLNANKQNSLSTTRKYGPLTIYWSNWQEKDG